MLNEKVVKLYNLCASLNKVGYEEKVKENVMVLKLCKDFVDKRDFHVLNLCRGRFKFKHEKVS